MHGSEASGHDNDEGDAMETRSDRERRAGWKAPAGMMTGVLLAAVMVVAGCDVTNPGPVEDRFLNDATARQGIINGIKVAYKDALATCDQGLGVDGGTAVRELFPSGNPGSCGVSVQEGRGNLRPDETSGVWNLAQEARWVAEDAITRFDSTMESGTFESSEHVAEAAVWAGYANRMMGEHFCRAVIDGGSPQPYTAFFERAEQYFTQGLNVAQSAGDTELENAALAGRAQARMHLGDWAGAVQDAQAVAEGFSFELPYHAVSQAQYNFFHWAQVGEPYRTISVWNTPYGEYYTETVDAGDDDPRVAWEEHPDYEFGDLARFDQPITLWVQQKHTSNSAPITLADKREMRYIVAEQLLVSGDWEAAMDSVNQLRAEADAPSWAAVEGSAASSEEEAWTRFRFERGIELWLEARRMGDLRRWAQAGVPGDLQPLEDPESSEFTGLQPKPEGGLCYPIPDSERETNPDVGG